MYVWLVILRLAMGVDVSPVMETLFSEHHDSQPVTARIGIV